MKRYWKNNGLYFTVIILLLLASCDGASDHAEHSDTYTCPMHPTVISDRPGTCPVCGMELVRKAPAGEAVKITEDLARLLKSPNEVIVSSVQAISGVYKSMPVSVKATGVVTYDTRKISTIPARVGGRIERVYLKYEFQAVAQGQKVAEIYSPELITAQRELLFLTKNDAENELLIDGSKNKLRLLGLSDRQVRDLIARGETANTFSIYSPYDGFVITSDAAPSTSLTPSNSPGSGGGGMNGMNSPAASAQQGPTTSRTGASFIREGSYVTAGQTLFKIVNTDALRIELDLPGTHADAIRAGDRVELDPGNGKTEVASVDLVQPFFNEGQNFLKVRVFSRQTDELRIGQLVRAKISLDSRESLWLPREAVLDLGTEKIVFVKDREILKPKKVITGIRADNLVEIKSGLASTDSVAASAQYLVDSESFIKTVD